MSFSRDGLRWNHVNQAWLTSRAHPAHSGPSKRKLSTEPTSSVFLSSGETTDAWDAGWVELLSPPLVVGNELRFYYQGGQHSDRANARGTGIGLATLRQDGFVSVGTDGKGTLTTRRIIVIGDTLVINANAKGGSIRVEAVDALGRVIKGFSQMECQPMTGDRVRHVVTWKARANCHPLQARPIQLRFHIKNAQLFGFEFQIRHNHFVPVSYSQ